MKVPFSCLAKIDDIEEYSLKYNPAAVNYQAVISMICKPGNNADFDIVRKKHIIDLTRTGIEELSLQTDEKFKEKLKRLAPSLLVKPSGKMRLGNLILLAKEYDKMNLKCSKQRRVIILEDVYSSDFNSLLSKKQMLIEYGTLLSEGIVGPLEKKVDLLKEVEYKDSEEGVLLFVPDVKDFALKVDLLAVLASMHLQIFDAKTVQEALEVYKTGVPKLVIMGSSTDSLETKALYLELEEYDPFVKKMNYAKTPATQRKTEIEMIRKYYMEGYTKILELAMRKKEKLPDTIKQSLIVAIQALNTGFTVSKFVDLAFVVKKYERMFNVVTLKNMLNNVRIAHSLKTFY